MRLQYHRWATCTLFVFAGCGTAGFNGFLIDFGPPAKVSAREIEEHRVQFNQERDPKAFRWLLNHAIENGMTVREVEHALGDSGERVFDDVAVKSKHREFLHSDIAYKWGPDSDGNSVVLFFREGRLIQYQADKAIDKWESEGFL